MFTVLPILNKRSPYNLCFIFIPADWILTLLVSLLQMMAWDFTCNTFRFYRLSSFSRTAHSYMILQECLLYLPAQSQCGSGTRRQTVTWGKMDRAAKIYKSNNRTSTCCFVQGGIQRTVVHTKVTSSLATCVCFWQKLSEMDFTRVPSGPRVLYWDLCSQPRTILID